jgi:hypothetical protein
MAIFHFSIKAISRSKGRSATGAAAYRAATSILDDRTGEIHDYSRKSGVQWTELIFPKCVSHITRSVLWNTAEAAENRKNSTVAREYEVALPAEMTFIKQKKLAQNFARLLVDRFGVAADIAIHAPGRGGDGRNRHAHILTTTRQIAEGGILKAKTRALDDKKTGEVGYLRATWANLVNQSLEQAGHLSRVDHRSLKKQGKKHKPTIHLGPKTTAMERRGISTERGKLNRKILDERKDYENTLKAAQEAQDDLAEALALETSGPTTQVNKADTGDSLASRKKAAQVRFEKKFEQFLETHSFESIKEWGETIPALEQEGNKPTGQDGPKMR